jgi:uncharacterized protein
VRPLLLDTGPIVAYLDRSDAAHDFVAPRLDCLRSGLVTTGAVVTEAMFLLQDVPEGSEALVAFLVRSGAAVFDAFSIPALNESARLMAKYADTPMDFADATLVVAAQHLDSGDILTLDERGFRTYRFSRRKSFHLALQDSMGG